MPDDIKNTSIKLKWVKDGDNWNAYGSEYYWTILKLSLEKPYRLIRANYEFIAGFYRLRDAQRVAQILEDGEIK